MAVDSTEVWIFALEIWKQNMPGPFPFWMDGSRLFRFRNF